MYKHFFKQPHLHNDERCEADGKQLQVLLALVRLKVRNIICIIPKSTVSGASSATATAAVIVTSTIATNQKRCNANERKLNIV